MKSFICSPQFAAITTLDEYRRAMGSVLGIIMILAFIIGVVLIMGGALKRDDNPAGAKNAMIAGSIIAGSTAIMGVMFAVFGNSGAVVDSAFN